MSRLVDDIRARARLLQGCASGYCLAGESFLSREAERLADDLERVAAGIEQFAEDENSAARQWAREQAA